MKKSTKALLTALCAVLLIVASVFGTLAYLTDEASVTNTITVGKVGISMVESVVNEYGEKTQGTTDEGNNYKLVPGRTYTKDPTITVENGSEDCYLFVKVDNGLGTDAVIAWNEALWKQVPGTTDVWYYDEVAKAERSYMPFESFQFKGTADPAQYADETIDITAYALQASGFEDKTPAQRWQALSDQLTANAGNNG